MDSWKTKSLSKILTLKYGKGLPERDRIVGPYTVVSSSGISGYHNQPFVIGPGMAAGER